MMVDDLSLYLPKYLSSQSEKDLFEELKKFPNNIDSRLYTKFLEDSNILYQGDGLIDMLLINLPDTQTNKSSAIIISNTCDMSIENIRFFQSQILYAPIFNLKKYKNMLSEHSKYSSQQIDGHIKAITKQEITQIFYLPKYENRLDDSIVFLDRILNIPNLYCSRNNLKQNRIFTLSDYGVYLFLIKLSIHFTRIKDKVERKSFKERTV